VSASLGKDKWLRNARAAQKLSCGSESSEANEAQAKHMRGLVLLGAMTIHTHLKGQQEEVMLLSYFYLLVLARLTCTCVGIRQQASTTAPP
jgi:hypothetical protein